MQNIFCGLRRTFALRAASIPPEGAKAYRDWEPHGNARPAGTKFLPGNVNIHDDAESAC